MALASAHGNLTFAAAFTTDKDKAITPRNVPARDSVSVPAINACATLGREAECGDRTFSPT